MDIHAPESPIHSFRDFATHIAVVTVGILIALGLEGAREAIVTHRLVAETRANFRAEMDHSLENMQDERKRVDTGTKTLDALAAQMPALGAQHPEQVLAALASVKNPNYFFAANSWQAALSSGVLAHMKTDEVSAYAWSAEGARIYSGLQTDTMAAGNRASAFWKVHPHPSAEQAEAGAELVLLYAQSEDSLNYVGPQTQSGMRNALHAAGGHSEFEPRP